ncbi:MAG: hypothetical protein R3C97_09730 [Geminicoccaceae bacterium]
MSGRVMSVMPGIQSLIGAYLPPLPLLQLDRRRTLVIRASHPGRRHDAGETEFGDTFRGDVEMFEAPADFLAGEGLVAELLLRGDHRLDGEGRIDEAAIVENLTDFRIRTGTIARCIEGVTDLRKDRAASPASWKVAPI